MLFCEIFNAVANFAIRMLWVIVKQAQNVLNWKQQPPLSAWIHSSKPGTVARSDARPSGPTVAGSILTSGKTFFRWDLVMKKHSTAILSLPLIQEGQMSVSGETMGTKCW